MGKQVKFPTYQMAANERDKLLRRYILEHPMSLVKSGGTWRAVVTPAQDELAVAENYYIGGYTYPLTEAQAADLPPEYVEEV